MQKYTYCKGSHILQVVELEDMARVQGLNGWIDSVELMTLLLENGYNFIK